MLKWISIGKPGALNSPTGSRQLWHLVVHPKHPGRRSTWNTSLVTNHQQIWSKLSGQVEKTGIERTNPRFGKQWSASWSTSSSKICNSAQWSNLPHRKRVHSTQTPAQNCWKPSSSSGVHLSWYLPPFNWQFNQSKSLEKNTKHTHTHSHPFHLGRWHEDAAAGGDWRWDRALNRQKNDAKTHLELTWKWTWWTMCETVDSFFGEKETDFGFTLRKGLDAYFVGSVPLPRHSGVELTTPQRTAAGNSQGIWMDEIWPIGAQIWGIAGDWPPATSSN